MSSIYMNNENPKTFVVLGVLIQFLSTPDQVKDNISVMSGTIHPGVVIPLHSHSDPEIFYILEGKLDAYQADGPSAEWKSIGEGAAISIPGKVKHALRNASSVPAKMIGISKTALFNFFQELAAPFDPSRQPSHATPEEMQHFFSIAAKYEYWLGSPEENSAIGLLLS